MDDSPQTVGNARSCLVDPGRVTSDGIKNVRHQLRQRIYLIRMASILPIKSCSLSHSKEFTWVHEFLTLFFWTASRNPTLPDSSSPSINMIRSTLSDLLRKSSAAAHATAIIGPLSSVAPRPYKYPFLPVRLKGSVCQSRAGAAITS